MLKKPCPYHQGPVKHTLEECTMLRRYYAKLGLPNDDAKKKGEILTNAWNIEQLRLFYP